MEVGNSLKQTKIIFSIHWVCSHLQGLFLHQHLWLPDGLVAAIPSGRFTPTDSFAYSVHLGDSSAVEKAGGGCVRGRWGALACC